MTSGHLHCFVYFFGISYSLTRYMVLVAIDYATRKVEVAGIVQQANGDWVKQVIKNLTDPFDGFLKDKKYLIHDRDTLFLIFPRQPHLLVDTILTSHA